jgi:hypothetical protein
MSVINKINQGKVISVKKFHEGFDCVKYPFMGKSSGKPKKRHVKLSKDKQKIIWGNIKNDLNRSVDITRITKFEPGEMTETFGVYKKEVIDNWNDLRCASFHCYDANDDQRTLDFLFDSDEECLYFKICLVYLLNYENEIIEKLISDHSKLQSQLF